MSIGHRIVMARQYFYLAAIYLSVLFCLPSHSLGQAVERGEQELSEASASQGREKVVDQGSVGDLAEDEEKDRANRRRIVDAQTIEERRSLVGSVLLRPFRAIAPIVTNRITQFEENREYRLLFGLKGDFPINPQFGGVSPGSGFGVGFSFSTRDHLSKDFRIVGSSVVTFSKYVENTAGFEITPRALAESELKIGVTARQSIRPKEDFFGSGANSFRSDRTTFFQRQLGVRFDASWKFGRAIKIGAFSELTRNDITDGSDARGIPITARFSSQSLSGLDRNIRMLESGLFTELEGRDAPESPHSGWFARFSFSSSDSLGRNNFGWFTYQFDARAYIPIGSKDRVLAVRLLGDLKDVKGDSSVPLFRLSRLGDNETLRGYELNRFQGLNALHLNLEYRFKLIQGIETSGFRGMEAIFFGDLGQVFDNRQELSWANLKSTWGGGIQFTSRESVAMAILYGRSPEGGRLLVRFGKTF